jgi:hypothetical protein
MPDTTVDSMEETSMRRRLILPLAAVLAALSMSTQAFALDCRNISRNVSPSEYSLATTASPVLAFPVGYDLQTNQAVFWNIMPDFKGNWYLLALSEGAPEPSGQTVDVWWGFIPPGTIPGLPGSSGNYTNGSVDDLLGMAACPVVRQDIHGIQSNACN